MIVDTGNCVEGVEVAVVARDSYAGVRVSNGVKRSGERLC